MIGEKTGKQKDAARRVGVVGGSRGARGGGGLKAPGGLFAVQETQAPAEQSINTASGEESLALPSISSLFSRCVFKPFDLLIARTA